MTRKLLVSTLALALGFVVPTRADERPAAQHALGTDAARNEEIRDALLKLPYYGVFDVLMFAYDKGTVTLSGYAYSPSLIADATRAVKRVPGVDEVSSTIEQLPAGSVDDDIRWRVFYAIYTNTFLSRYSPGGGLIWGQRGLAGAATWLGAIPGFAGMQPVGNYPIHIIVKGSRVQLVGMVDTEADKAAAGLAARNVSSALGIDNRLSVGPPSS